MASIFKYAFPIFKYRPDIQIFEYISHYFYITIAFLNKQLLFKR